MRKTGRKVGIVLLAVLAMGWMLLAGGRVFAEELEFRITIRDHRFEPAELQVPTGTRFKLIVKNADATPEEFESHSLHWEKVIPGTTEVVLNMGPLKPGRYEFVGEFHENTAKGVLIAK